MAFNLSLLIAFIISIMGLLTTVVDLNFTTKLTLSILAVLITFIPFAINFYVFMVVQPYSKLKLLKAELYKLIYSGYYKYKEVEWSINGSGIFCNQSLIAKSVLKNPRLFLMVCKSDLSTYTYESVDKSRDIVGDGCWIVFSQGKERLRYNELTGGLALYSGNQRLDLDEIGIRSLESEVTEIRGKFFIGHDGACHAITPNNSCVSSFSIGEITVRVIIVQKIMSVFCYHKETGLKYEIIKHEVDNRSAAEFLKFLVRFSKSPETGYCSPTIGSRRSVKVLHCLNIQEVFENIILNDYKVVYTELEGSYVVEGESCSESAKLEYAERLGMQEFVYPELVNKYGEEMAEILLSHNVEFWGKVNNKALLYICDRCSGVKYRTIGPNYKSKKYLIDVSLLREKAGLNRLTFLDLSVNPSWFVYKYLALAPDLSERRRLLPYLSKKENAKSFERGKERLLKQKEAYIGNRGESDEIYDSGSRIKGVRNLVRDIKLLKEASNVLTKKRTHVVSDRSEENPPHVFDPNWLNITEENKRGKGKKGNSKTNKDRIKIDKILEIGFDEDKLGQSRASYKDALKKLSARIENCENTWGWKSKYGLDFESLCKVRLKDHTTEILEKKVVKSRMVLEQRSLNSSLNARRVIESVKNDNKNYIDKFEAEIIKCKGIEPSSDKTSAKMKWLKTNSEHRGKIGEIGGEKLIKIWDNIYNVLDESWDKEIFEENKVEEIKSKSLAPSRKISLLKKKVCGESGGLVGTRIIRSVELTSVIDAINNKIELSKAPEIPTSTSRLIEHKSVRINKSCKRYLEYKRKNKNKKKNCGEDRVKKGIDKSAKDKEGKKRGEGGKGKLWLKGLSKRDRMIHDLTFEKYDLETKFSRIIEAPKVGEGCLLQFSYELEKAELQNESKRRMAFESRKAELMKLKLAYTGQEGPTLVRNNNKRKLKLDYIYKRAKIGHKEFKNQIFVKNVSADLTISEEESMASKADENKRCFDQEAEETSGETSVLDDFGNMCGMYDIDDSPMFDLFS